jgi:hypothetical protein
MRPRPDGANVGDSQLCDLAHPQATARGEAEQNEVEPRMD